MGTSEGICLASPTLVPRLLPTSRGWPRGPSLRAQFSREVVSLAVPGSARIVPHTIGLLKVVWGRVRLREGDMGCIFVVVTHGTQHVPVKVQAVVLTDRLLPQPLCDWVWPEVPWAKFPCRTESRDSFGWVYPEKYLVTYVKL